MNDNDLDKKLELLRNIKPDDLQMHKWKVTSEHQWNKSKPPRFQFSWTHFGQLAASACFGLIIGAFIFGSPKESTNISNIDYDNATIEVVYTKL